MHCREGRKTAISCVDREALQRRRHSLSPTAPLPSACAHRLKYGQRSHYSGAPCASFLSLPFTSSSPGRHRVLSPPTTKTSRTDSSIAIMSLGMAQTVDFHLRDAMGDPVAEATLELPPKGHVAKFIGELEWDNPPDFTDFLGSLLIDSAHPFAAVGILVTPGEFVTLPVRKLD